MKKCEKEVLLVIKKAMGIIPNASNRADTISRESHRIDLKIVNKLCIEVLDSLLDEDVVDTFDVKESVSKLNNFIETRIKEDWCNINDSEYSYLSWER